MEMTARSIIIADIQKHITLFPYNFEEKNLSQLGTNISVARPQH
jgi:hypothetical protein